MKLRSIVTDCVAITGSRPEVLWHQDDYRRDIWVQMTHRNSSFPHNWAVHEALQEILKEQY